MERESELYRYLLSKWSENHTVKRVSKRTVDMLLKRVYTTLETMQAKKWTPSTVPPNRTRWSGTSFRPRSPHVRVYQLANSTITGPTWAWALGVHAFIIKSAILLSILLARSKRDVYTPDYRLYVVPVVRMCVCMRFRRIAHCHRAHCICPFPIVFQSSKGGQNSHDPPSFRLFSCILEKVMRQQRGSLHSAAIYVGHDSSDLHTNNRLSRQIFSLLHL